MRDNDGAYGRAFTNRVQAMGIRDRPISPKSPWQNPYAERLIGTLRRDSRRFARREISDRDRATATGETKLTMQLLCARTPPAKKLAARGLRPPAAARRRLTNNIQLVDKAQGSQQVDLGLVVAGDGGCIVQAGLVGGILGHEHIDC